MLNALFLHVEFLILRTYISDTKGWRQL